MGNPVLVESTFKMIFSLQHALILMACGSVQMSVLVTTQMHCEILVYVML